MTAATDGSALRLRILVIRCQAGDEAAFAVLLDRFGPAVHRYLAGLVDDGADDVAQELWLTVYRRIGELADPGAFRTWLFRSARHRAIDWLRKRRRERELFADVEPAGVPSAGTTDDDFAGLDLGDAIRALAPLHREVILLRYRDDLSYGEIALVVGVAIGTVRSRLHHAHRHLRQILNPPPDIGAA